MIGICPACRESTAGRCWEHPLLVAVNVSVPVAAPISGPAKARPGAATITLKLAGGDKK